MTDSSFRDEMSKRFAPTGPAAPAAKAPPPLPPKKSPPPLPPKPAADGYAVSPSDAADRLRAIAASLPAYVHSTELPTPESGFINPPSDPPVRLAATPEELAAIQGIEPVAPPPPKSEPVADELDGMTRAQLLEVGLAIGAFDAGTKLRETGLKAKIRAKRTEWSKVDDHDDLLIEKLGRADLEKIRNEMGTVIPLAHPEDLSISQEQLTEELKQVVEKMSPQETKLIDTLYVNARPDHGDVVSYATLLVEANKLIQRESGAVDYRRIPNSYGAGPAYLGAAVKSYLEESTAGVKRGRVLEVYVDVRTPEGSAMLAVLESLASTVVRGV